MEPERLDPFTEDEKSRFKRFVDKLDELPSVFREVESDLQPLLEQFRSGTLTGTPEEIEALIEDLLTTARNASERLQEEAESIHDCHVSLAPDWIDPAQIAERRTGDTYRDEYAREVWSAYRNCTIDELESVGLKLGEIIESTRSSIAGDLKAGDEPRQKEMDRFLEAYFRRPIIDHMAELAALEGPEIPSWEEVRWQKQVDLELRGNDRSNDALRVLYFLLIQQRRRFDDAESTAPLYDAAGKIMGIRGRSVERNLRRGTDKEIGSLADLDRLFETIDGWRQWLEGRNRLRIDVSVSQDFV